MAYNVKVVSKSEKKGESEKGPYTYISLVVDYMGKESEKKIFSTALKKYPNLKGELASITEGMTIGLETVDNGRGYKEISRLIVDGGDKGSTNRVNNSTNRTSTTTTTAKTGGTFDALGAQVGNAITNACRTVGEKATMKTIETRTWELILLGERIKERMNKGEHLNTEPTTAAAVKTNDEDQYNDTLEDIPF